MKPTRTTLTPEEMPRKWYNILPDLPVPLPPPLNPGTKQPISPSDLEVIFPKALIKQEVSQDNYIDIPEEVLQAYMMANRPSPLQRAVRLRSDTRARTSLSTRLRTAACVAAPDGAQRTVTIASIRSRLLAMTSCE